MSLPPSVCVAICTHDRPVQLRALLDGLLQQTYAQPFPVIIVDNGTIPAADIVQRYRDRLRIVLDPISQAGLAAVRNRAMQLGLDHGCDFLAFIDDDEVPVPGWLTALMRAQHDSQADLVFGPVLATYHGTPPKWVTDGGFFERWGDTPGSGNALIRLEILPANPKEWFLDVFGATGGEDADFFDRLMDKGAVHAVAPKAIAYEDTPPERASLRFIWRRGVRDGAVIAQRIALRDRPLGAKILSGASQFGAKLGHASNHFFRALFTPWRAIKGIADIGAAWAILRFALGHRFHFYGPKPTRLPDSRP